MKMLFGDNTFKMNVGGFFYDMMHVDMMHIAVNKIYMMQVVDLVGVNMI